MERSDGQAVCRRVDTKAPLEDIAGPARQQPPPVCTVGRANIVPPARERPLEVPSTGPSPLKKMSILPNTDDMPGLMVDDDGQFSNGRYIIGNPRSKALGSVMGCL